MGLGTIYNTMQYRASCSNAVEILYNSPFSSIVPDSINEI